MILPIASAFDVSDNSNFLARPIDFLLFGIQYTGRHPGGFVREP